MEELYKILTDKYTRTHYEFWMAEDKKSIAFIYCSDDPDYDETPAELVEIRASIRKDVQKLAGSKFRIHGSFRDGQQVGFKISAK